VKAIAFLGPTPLGILCGVAGDADAAAIFRAKAGPFHNQGPTAVTAVNDISLPADNFVSATSGSLAAHSFAAAGPSG
jgi:hypothetical protein